MHIIDINCTGAEIRVLECPHNNLMGEHVCDHRQDASVRCQGKLLSSCTEPYTYCMHVSLKIVRPGTMFWNFCYMLLLMIF